MPEEDTRPCHVPEEKECAEEECQELALSFRDRCWEHTTYDEYAKFRKEIIRRAESESLKGANLEHTYLHAAELAGANLQKANLQTADLSCANLQKANLASVDLQGANLSDANLQEADLWRTNLRGARLVGIIWRGARYLIAERVGETREYIQGQWTGAEDAYRRLKNYFHEEGRYDDESWAFVMEKTCARRKMWQKGVRGKLRSAGSWGWCALANYGERWWQAALWAVGIIVAFTLSYWPSPWRWTPSLVRLDYNGPLDLSSFWTSLYFSVVTFATLGFGDIKPANGWGIAAVIGEVLCGYVMLGTLVALIARKMTR